MCTARRFSLIIAATLRPVSFIPMNRESDRNSLYWLRPRLRSGFPIRRLWRWSAGGSDRARSSNRNLLSCLPSSIPYLLSVPSGLFVDSHYVYGTSVMETFAKVPWKKRNAFVTRLRFLALVPQTPVSFSSGKITTQDDRVKPCRPLLAYATNNLPTCLLSHVWRQLV